MDFFAHTENIRGDWHKLADHLSAVGQLAADIDYESSDALVSSSVARSNKRQHY
jgi:hypothetical protein